jgi:pSer/pThr/pTyr-binding forkhead associated (FHA) protein
MNGEVILKVLHGVHPGKEYAFHTHTVCTVGRGKDCLLQLPCDLLHLDVSRRHCLFDIDAPEVRVRDLGSRNGTYVNGKLIGQRCGGLPPSEVWESELPEHALEDGDEVRVGETVFRVNISSMPHDTLTEEIAEECVLS